jgi:hypothetical protein
VSIRTALAVRHAELVDAIIEPAQGRSRAQQLVESGVIDIAASVADLAHHLTDEAVAAMTEGCMKRGIDLPDTAFLRSVTFDAIVRCILARLRSRDDTNLMAEEVAA